MGPISARMKSKEGIQMCKVNCEEIVDGLMPTERIARIKSAEGHVEEVTLPSSLVVGNSIEAAFVGSQDDKVLVELPRESSSGRWRVWVDRKLLG